MNKTNSYRGRHRLDRLVEHLTRPARRKRGLAEQRLLTDWPTIVGAGLAAHCLPQKMVPDRREQKGAQLHILTDPAWALEIQHLEPVILDKIAVFFGYRAVDRLVIHQGALPSPAAQARVRPTLSTTHTLSPQTQSLLETVEDDTLKQALTRLDAIRKNTRPAPTD